jgi:hypothetical protein
MKINDIAVISKKWSTREYWSKVNIIEAWAFMTKIAIIFPGLLFGVQWWWLYLLALTSSFSLIITSTIKTMPTIIWFNILWVILASLSILKHWWWF